MPPQSAPVFRGSVELFTVRVHVTAAKGQALPELDSTGFSIRIGSHPSPVLLVEHAAMPTEAERADGPFAFFKPLPHQLSALYVVGIDANDAQCRVIPRVSVTGKGLKVKAIGWTAKRGCEPPGARRIGETVSGKEP